MSTRPNNAAHLALGAALTFGADLVPVGQAIFRQAYSILEQGKKTEDLPLIHIPNNRKVTVNLEAAKLQGLDIDEALLFAMNHNEIIG